MNLRSGEKIKGNSRIDRKFTKIKAIKGSTH